MSEFVCINGLCQWQGDKPNRRIEEFTDDDDNGKTFTEPICPHCGWTVFRNIADKEDPMTKYAHILSPAELERLALLSEECAEVIQIISKICRHGYESYHPKDPAKTSNRDLLVQEIGHVGFAIQIMDQKADLSLNDVRRATDEKAQNVQQYLHYQ